jgi:hypothetical protein
MSSQAAYFEAQTRLTRWTDELEFRGYILCELIDAESLNAIGFQCHQAADMPALINIIRPHTTEPSGNLTAIMSEDELKDFHQLMKKANQIRNKSAHHIIQSADKLKGLEDVKRRFSDMLDFSTRSIASDRGIHQVCSNIQISLDNMLIRHLKGIFATQQPQSKGPQPLQEHGYYPLRKLRLQQ